MGILGQNVAVYIYINITVQCSIYYYAVSFCYAFVVVSIHYVLIICHSEKIRYNTVD